MSSDGNRTNSGDRNNTLSRVGDSDNVVRIRERRRQSDALIRAAILMSALAWVVLFAVWIVMYFAGIVGEYGNTPINIITDSPAQHEYSLRLIPIAFTLLLISLVICIAAFIFNRLRMRRSTDRYRISIFIVAGVTIIALIVFILNFGSLLFR